MITREEYGWLNIYRSEGFRWIIRDKNKWLYVYDTEPEKRECEWRATKRPSNVDYIEEGYRLFPNVKWEDEEPTKILDLIQDYEAHQVITQESKKAVIPECYEVLSDEWLAEHSEFADGVGEFYIYETFENMEKLLIPKHVKVTVPQYVADWIEEVKALKRSFKLEILFDTTEMPNDVYDWLDERYGDTDILAKAWMDGYEVEKEKLYTVRLANGSCLYRYVSVGIDWIKAPSDYRNDKDFHLTQTEIESVDPRLMQFAEEVE